MSARSSLKIIYTFIVVQKIINWTLVTMVFGSDHGLLLEFQQLLLRNPQKNKKSSLELHID